LLTKSFLLVIDGENGVSFPDFPWICGDDLYTKLGLDYHM